MDVSKTVKEDTPNCDGPVKDNKKKDEIYND